jgi:ribosomal 50S subunit-recycling heat shock protein
MRLDRFLKVSRIIKRRSIAKAVCDAGRVLLNDHPAKAGKTLHMGDILCIRLSDKKLTCQVLSIPTGSVRAAEASSLYRVISEEKLSAGDE